MQPALPLGFAPSFRAEDFLIAPANDHAVRYLAAWPGWAWPVTLLIGPAQSGKSHLAHMFSESTGGRVCCLSDAAAQGAVPTLAVEDLDATSNAETLFHLINRSLQGGPALLLLMRTHPQTWSQTSPMMVLPDLASRLQAAPVLRLGPPDAGMIAPLLVKLLADRGIRPPPDVVSYVALRAPLDFERLAHLVAALDAASLAAASERGSLGRGLSAPLAAKVLQNLALEEDCDTAS